MPDESFENLLVAFGVAVAVPLVVLKDATRSGGAVGQLTIGAASVAGFGAIVLLTPFFPTSGASGWAGSRCF